MVQIVIYLSDVRKTYRKGHRRVGNFPAVDVDSFQGGRHVPCDRHGVRLPGESGAHLLQNFGELDVALVT